MSMKQKAIYLGLGVLAGVIFAPQVAKLPLVNKLPTL